ncbi:MAG: HNH endonuclease, partial [Candidatus Binatia bacterium]
HENRGRRILGELVAVFRRRERYIPLGFVRLGDYTRERLGCSASEAKTAARVAEGLRRLPGVARAFEEGQVPWTKARILVSAASEETEKRWLELAKRVTVRELERQVKAQRDDDHPARERASSGKPEARADEDAPTSGDSGADADQECSLRVAAPCAAAAELGWIREDDGEEIDGEPRVRFRLSCPDWVWLFFRRMVDLARKVSGEEVPVWKAVEAICAEGRSAAPCDPSSEEVVLEALARSARWRCASAPAPAGLTSLPRDREDFYGRAEEDHGEGALEPPDDVAEWLRVSRDELRDVVPEAVTPLANGAEEATPVELDRRMRAVVRELQRIDWRTGRLLRLLFERRLERLVGFPSEEDYLRDRLGMAVRKARVLIALDRMSDDAPELGEAYREGRISWVRAMILLPLIKAGVSVPLRPWLARAREVSVRGLSDEVAWAIERRAAGQPGWFEPPPLGGKLAPVALEVPEDPQDPQDVAAGLAEGGMQMRDGSVIELSAPASVAATFRHLLIAWSEPGEPSWKGLVRLLAHVFREWQRTQGRRNRIMERDDYRCRVACCTSRRNLHTHHLVYRSAGGGEDDDNLAGACAAHHLNGVHVNRIRARGNASDEIVWELGVGQGPRGESFLRLRGDVYLGAG